MDDTTTTQPCAFCGLTDAVAAWSQHPFSGSGSALNWVLTIGLILVAVWFWQWVLLKLREDI